MDPFEQQPFFLLLLCLSNICPNKFSRMSFFVLKLIWALVLNLCEFCRLSAISMIIKDSLNRIDKDVQLWTETDQDTQTELHTWTVTIQHIIFIREIVIQKYVCNNKVLSWLIHQFEVGHHAYIRKKKGWKRRRRRRHVSRLKNNDNFARWSISRKRIQISKRASSLCEKFYLYATTGFLNDIL